MEPNTFTPTTWDEHVVSGAGEQPRFAYAHTSNRYAGVIDGESVGDYLLYYSGPGYTGSCTGLERIEGSVNGHKGSFLIQHDGRFDEGGIQGTWRVLADSGTGELHGISGNGSLTTAMHAESVAYTFDYDLP